MALVGRLDATVRDDRVEFTITVNNDGSESVELAFGSSLVADVAVYDHGEEVWRFSDGRAFTQVVSTETLAPGESLAHDATWRAAPAGEYEAVATLEATDAAAEARTTVVV